MRVEALSLGAMFDWATFITSVTTAVIVTLVVDWTRDTSKKLLSLVKARLLKLIGRLRHGHAD